MIPVRSRATLAAVVLLLCASLPHSVAGQAATGGFGVLGDSGSDEFRADDNRGGAYAATTFNWVELLVRYRGLDVGAWGTRDEPRRSGYEYNWARSGATAADVISGGQAAGLAQQVADGQVTRALLMIGENDFAIWNNTYQDVYDGALSGAALTQKIDGIVGNITQALDIVRSAGPVDLLVATLGDRGVTPAFQAAFTDPAKRQIVTQAIISVNNGIQAAAAARGIQVVDVYNLGSTLLPQVDANGNLNVGGQLISLVVPGDEPHHMLLGDAEHAGTVSEGILANLIVAGINATGLSIHAFTDQELVQNAGIVLPDRTPPMIAMTAPNDGATVSTAVVISADASDNDRVAGVRFQVDGVNLGGLHTAAPYAQTWNATNVTPGTHVLTAIATDPAGNTASASRSVTVVDVTPPAVSLTSPANNAKIAGTLTVSATASDNIRVAGVTFYWGNTALGPEDTVAPYTISVSTAYPQNGQIALTAVARDASGNTRTSSAIVVTINNPVPDTTPPTVAIAAPSAGATVAGVVTVSATAGDNVGVAGVQFTLDGVSLGTEKTASPYTVSWDTRTATNGSHTIGAIARDAAGNRTTSTPIAITVSNPVQTGLALDVNVSADRSTSSKTIATGTFSTHSATELLLAFVAADAAATGTNNAVTRIDGGGLTWQLVGRTNAQRGTAEIWRTLATTALTNATVTATFSQSAASSITVVGFTGVSTTGTSGSGAIGAVATANGSALPSASLTTTRNGSWVIAVGNDWDRATARKVGANQTLVHQYLSSGGDTYWVQMTATSTAVAGTVVTINDTAPSGDRYNLSVCEVLPK